MIPLVERGADLIILSQIASDSNINFGDLKLAKKQILRFFGLEVDIDRLISPHGNETEGTRFITKSCISKENSNISTILLIKPSQKNIEDFYNFLVESGKHNSLLTFLEENEMDQNKKKRFPQNSTMKTKYEQKLIYAYYILGKYLGEEKLTPEIYSWVNNGRNSL